MKYKIKYPNKNIPASIKLSPFSLFYIQNAEFQEENSKSFFFIIFWVEQKKNVYRKGKLLRVTVTQSIRDESENFFFFILSTLVYK